MGRSNYVRLYLAAKFCKPEDDGTYKAAIVLWARKDDVELKVNMDVMTVTTFTSNTRLTLGHVSYLTSKGSSSETLKAAMEETSFPK